MPTTDPDDVVRQLVAAALTDADPDALLTRAGAAATTPRSRQLVAIADAHRRGDHDLVDALARDHLVDHPDSVLAAWIAAVSRHEASVPEPSNPKEAP